MAPIEKTEKHFTLNAFENSYIIYFLRILLLKKVNNVVVDANYKRSQIQ